MGGLEQGLSRLPLTGGEKLREGAVQDVAEVVQAAVLNLDFGV